MLAPSMVRAHAALDAIAATFPTLKPHLDSGQAPTLAALRPLLAGSPWSIAPAKLARELGYEAAVGGGRIPTRDGSWHDTFNLLAFLCFPQSKRALHRRALDHQEQRRAAGLAVRQRSREEDALAILDEAALLVAGPAPALADFDEARRAGDLDAIDALHRREQLTVWVLGHALLEHLILDRPPIGAGVVTVSCASRRRDDVDLALAARIDAGGFPEPRLSPTLPWPDPRVDRWLTPLS